MTTEQTREDVLLAALKAGYWLSLHTDGLVRVLNQQSLCAMRDAIALVDGRDPEDVQNEFELSVMTARRSERPAFAPQRAEQEG